MNTSKRKILPNRRLTETRKVETPRGQTAFVSIGFDPGNPLAPREVFYSGGLKSGSDLEYHLQDMCVLISLLLQHEMAPSEIARSLSRRETELGGISYASLVGWVLDAVREPPAWAEAYRAAADAQIALPGMSHDTREKPE